MLFAGCTPVVTHDTFGHVAAIEAPDTEDVQPAPAPVDVEASTVRRYPVRIVRVIDGDSFVADVSLGLGLVLRDQTFRVLGIDTPELKSKVADLRAAAQRAKARLQDLLKAPGATVLIDDRNPREKYGRLLASVETGTGADVAHVLIAEGLAKSYDGGKR